MSASTGSGERRLAAVFRSLDPDNRRTLLAFAEFLAARGASQAHAAPDAFQPPLEPEPLPRPQRESVVGAIKRLSRSYHMLDRSALLTETSSLMASHIINGRPAEQVIDEIESLFARYYARYREGIARRSG